MTEMQSQKRRIKTWAKIANKQETQDYFRNKRQLLHIHCCFRSL